MTEGRNRLAGETSPYLLQHADNPVDWYPWGEEALALARESDRPVLLSIGYSACHWCHVMAHESFEDEETAALMNALFVNVKVDREERPDLDKIYQLAHQLLIQRPGGWPLTMFLTPGDQIPFFGGTYFPDRPRHGMPAFREVLQRVGAYYQDHRDEITGQAAAVRDVFARIDAAASPTDEAFDATPLATARTQLEQAFDERWGGFGRAPKFPHPTSIERLLRHWRGTATGAEPDTRALLMATLTLQRMAQGGIYDQLGGGFCRYSVDDYWMIPHFEKMLYDNGPLLALYGQAWAVTNEPLFARVAEETAGWVLREMQAPEGGYYSTLDADSEGEEGRFYAWDREEARRLVGEEAWPAFAAFYGFDRDPNFEGRWHLHQMTDLARAAAAGIDEETAAALIDAGRARLFEQRETRVRPGRDEKVLTAWNGLMIKGMAVAARHLGRAELAESATRAVEFLRDHVWRDGRLRVGYKDGRAGVPGFLDDYAFLIDGLLELLQVRWRTDLLGFALELAEVLLARFADPRAGGFYFTADDQASPIHRPRPLADEATPAGNGVAARALNRLGLLVGEPRYVAAAEGTLRMAWGQMREHPQAHCSLLDALEEQLTPVETVILRGPPEALARWHQTALLTYAPRRQVFAVPDDVADLPDGLADKRPADGPVAYRCTGPVCGPPLRTLSELAAALRETPRTETG